MTQDLSDLIARLEMAEAPCRELDALIACRFVFTDCRPASPGEDIAGHPLRVGDIKTEHGYLLADRYTSSLDAALSLAERVLPGWWISIAHNAGPQPATADLWRASVYPRDQRGAPAFNLAPTPALALCLAILKAVEAGKVEGRE